DGGDDGIALGSGRGQGGVNGLRELPGVEVALDTAHPTPYHEIGAAAPLQHQGLHGAMADVETHHPLTQEVENHRLAARATVVDVSNVSPRLPRKTGRNAEKCRVGGGAARERAV